MVKNVPAMQDTCVPSQVRKISWRRKWRFTLENFMNTGAWWVTVYGITKSWT